MAAKTTRTATNPLVVFEPLEPRLLLSGDVLASGYWVGSAYISSEWFESVSVSTTEAGGSSILDAEHILDQIDGKTSDPNQWIVQLTESAANLVSGVSDTISLFSGAPGSFDVLRGLGMKGQLLVSVSGADTEAIGDWLDGNSDIAYYEQDLVLATDVIPDDSSFSTLWGMNNTGQSGGTSDVDIDAPEAWEVSTGSSEIVVGVIDTGVDYTHPDLAANIWTNPGEVAGNGIDDDGNGFVDDIHGYDFVNEDGDPMDDHHHGTHVSGTIAAVGDNGIGVAGVNWSASIMGLKFLDSSGSGYTSNAVRALNYATMMKTTYDVNVVATNNSWGGGGYSTSLSNAIAASGDANMLFVAAAGNSAENNDSALNYPASYSHDNILSVAAVDRNGNLASFSCYGATTVDLGAPGVSIYSTTPGSTYASYSGTSMASPHVAGIAALAWSINPDATYTQVRDAILGGVESLSSLDGKTVTGGMANAANTLELMGMRVTTSSPAADDIVTSPVTEFQIAFSGICDTDSVQATDFTVNGIAADTYQMLDSTTILFGFNASPVSAEGPQTMELAADSILRDGDAEPLQAWSDVFYYDTIPLEVEAATPADGATLDEAPATITIQFNENIDPSSVSTDGLTLETGSVTEATLTAPDTVQFTVTGLVPEGCVEFTLAAGAVLDVDGNPSAVYAGDFTISDPSTTRYQSTDVPVTIVDLQTVTSTITITDSYPITDLDVELSITHTYDSDLDVYLVSPDSTRVTLFTHIGGSGDNFTHTNLDDEATTAITAGSAPFTGWFQPAEALSAFDGMDAAGTWTIEVTDNYSWDSGALASWAIILEGSDTNDTPVAVADSYSVDEDNTLTVAAVTGVLANDTDADGDDLTATLASGVSNGSLTLNSDGSFSYTPDADFNGTDSFTYLASDGTADSDPATVTITVNGVTDAELFVTLGWDSASGTQAVKKFDRATEELTSLGSVGDLQWWQGQSVLDTAHNQLYLAGLSQGGQYQLYGVDIETGTVGDAVALSRSDLVFSGIDADGKIIALAWNGTNTTEDVLKVDTSTGDIETVGTVGDMLCWQRQSVFDSATNQLYVAGMPAGGPSTLYVIDTTSGELTAEHELDQANLTLSGIDSDGDLVALRWNSSEAVEEVYKIDTATGSSGSRVGVVTGLKWWFGKSAFDAGNDALYVSGMSADATHKLFAFDVSAGTVTDAQALPAGCGAFISHYTEGSDFGASELGGLETSVAAEPAPSKLDASPLAVAASLESAADAPASSESAGAVDAAEPVAEDDAAVAAGDDVDLSGLDELELADDATSAAESDDTAAEPGDSLTDRFFGFEDLAVESVFAVAA